MDLSWAGIKTSVLKFWQKLSRPQKAITVAAPVLVAAALITLILWASKPQYVALFTKINDTDAAAITAKLTDLKVPYQLQDNGTTILVPKQQASQVRLQLVSAGLPQGSKFSFDYLNQFQIGETDADRQLQYTLALQSELEDTLKTLNGVQDARVHIVSPQPSLFTDQNQAATAGVTLQLTPGTQLSSDQVRGIADLLAASVQGLKPENVTIVDTAGDVLSDVLGSSNNPARLTGNQVQLEQAVEDNIQKSVQSMLDRVLGPGKAVVRANAVLDFDQIEIVDQKNGPGALVSKQTTSEASGTGVTVGGVPGTTTNTGTAAGTGAQGTAPSGQAQGAAGTAGGTTANGQGIPTYQATGTNTSGGYVKNTDTENYQVDTTQTKRTVAPGAIKRLSVSVMVDANSISPAEVQQIQGIVTNAAGIDPTRGDSVQVAALPFDKSTAQQTQQQFAAAQKRQQWVTYAEIGAATLLLLVFILGFWRSRSGPRALTEFGPDAEDMGTFPVPRVEEVLLAQQRAEEEAQLKMAQKQAKSAEEIEKQKVREAVDLYSRNNPDEVARLIKTWLSEEK